MKKIRYAFESLGMLVLMSLFRLVPLSVASAGCGALLRRIGRHLRIQKMADYNLRMAMPELTDAQRKAILNGMWDNLGRVLGEYPHLPTRKMAARVRLASGAEHIEAAKQHGRSILFMSAHLGNWECMPLAAHHFFDARTHLLYRPANNPVAEWLTKRLRKPYSPSLHAKGMGGARAVTQAIRKREHVAMLVDQKTNDGIAAPFFGHDAMTTTVVAQLALKYQVMIVPCYCVRRDGAWFDIHVEEPLATEGMDMLQITTAMNGRIEQWIRRHPEQWFWVHKRWPHSKHFAKTLEPKH